jgi:hypothetical protein
MFKKSVWRRVVLGVPTVMLVVIATAFTWDFASTSVKGVAGVFTDARGNSIQSRSYPSYRPPSSYNKSLNVAHLVSYSVAASLLVASTGFATRMMRDEK